MISATADVLDLDPAEWPLLHSLVLKARSTRRWGYVLHNGGVVLTRHPAALPIEPGDAVPDASTLAAGLLEHSDCDRVVVIDRGQLPDVARAGAALVTPDGDLTTYRERIDDLYWSAVVTAPPPAANPWRGCRELAEAVADGLVHVLVTRGSAPLTGIALTVVGGSVEQVSSPTSQDDPDVVLAVEEDELVAAIASADLVGGLLAAGSRHQLSRGLARLRTADPEPKGSHV